MPTRPDARERKQETSERPSNVWRREWESQAARSATPLTACAIKERCGNCRYINTDYPESLKQKYRAGLAVIEAQVGLARVRLMPPEPSPRPLAYRNHAKLAVRPGDDGSRFAIGLFKPHSHDVVEVFDCPVHRPTINSALLDLKVELEASTITAYDEAAHSGDLRYLALRSQHLTSELMLTFVATHDGIRRELRQIVCNLKAKGHGIASAYLNINAARTNTIFGTENVALTGSEGLRERICDLDFEIGPTGFFQINPYQAEQLYRRVEQLAGTPDEGLVAWDLYSGIGQMALILARSGYRTLGIEENPQAVTVATSNAQRNRLATPPEFLRGRVEDVHGDLPDWARRPSLIVANPARTGLADSVRPVLAEALASGRKTKLIYVSCEAKTLARDLADLVARGRTIIQLQAFDMFPFTDKMEWLAVID